MANEIQIQKEIKEHAEVVLSGTLSPQHIEAFWEKAVKAAQTQVSLPGFRKGHVPLEKLLQEVGEDFLWKQAAEMALQDALSDILAKEEVIPIAPLGLSLSHTKKGENAPFEITVITPPTVSAGDYKAAAKRALLALPTEDSEKEKGEAKKAFRVQVRAITKMKNLEEVKEGDAQKNEEKADEPLSDDEAKFAGFENSQAIEHFIDTEAERAVKDRAAQKRRGAIAEELIKEASAQIPKALIEEEARAMMDVFKRDVVGQGMEWNDYLKRVKKSESDVMNDLVPQAEKRITLDLVFGEIIKKEEVKLGEEDKAKEDEIAHALAAQEVPHERAHQYAKEQLLREKIWEVLAPTSDFTSQDTEKSKSTEK